ncbi:MAG: PQQ-dependent sugar dehydrogenase [Puniceicoccales bacterium]
MMCVIRLLMIAVGLMGAAQAAKVDEIYRQYCASCHGEDLRGGQGKSLVDGLWRGDGSSDNIAEIIRDGQLELGMPPFGAVLSEDDIRALVIYIREKEKAALAAPKPEPDAVTGAFDVAGERFRIEEVAEGFEIPWSVDFLPEGRYLVTERPGGLRVVEADGTVHPRVKGTPEVLAKGQGGMLDVALHPDYANTGWIYLSYSEPAQTDSDIGLTKIVRGRLEGNRWVDEETIFEAPQEFYSGAGVHFGTRIVFDSDGHLFFAIGDRGRQEQAQDTTRPNGKVHRINLDGSIPTDNPFAKDGFPTIWSYGNRNPQGLAIHPETGALWETEHGPRGGDEVNVIEGGKNYGWPVITYGMNYNGTPITGKTHAPGMEQPKHYWTPSIAVCGLDFYRGDKFPTWKNRLLVGSLRAQELHLLTLDGDEVVADEVILDDHGRVRDVASGPDGAIYVLLNGPDKLVRLVSEN